MKCKICKSKSHEFFSTKLLYKFDVKYYKCKSCGFVQTENPYWLNEAYTSAITSQDIGLIGRKNCFSNISQKSCLCDAF